MDSITLIERGEHADIFLFLSILRSSLMTLGYSLNVTYENVTNVTNVTVATLVALCYLLDDIHMRMCSSTVILQPTICLISFMLFQQKEGLRLQVQAMR